MIENYHIVAVKAARDELKASKGLYSLEDPIRATIDKHLTALTDLVRQLKEIRKEQLLEASDQPKEVAHVISERQHVQDKEVFMELLRIAGVHYEHVVEIRKGIPQTVYIVKIEESGDYYDWVEECLRPIPHWAVGYWRQRDAEDLTRKTLEECLKDEWVPTAPVDTRGWA